MATLQQGDVVCGPFPDPNGYVKPKRFAVVLSTAADIASEPTVLLVCITSTPRANPIQDSYVLLPWQPQGRCGTGLWKESWAVCDWLVEVEQNTLQATGAVPRATLLEILIKVAR